MEEPGERLQETNLMLMKLNQITHGVTMKRYLFSFAVYALGFPAVAQNFHTEPSCWDKPRIYHTGSPSVDLGRKIERTLNVTRTPRDDALVSLNGGYKTWVEIPNRPVGNVADQILYLYSEQERVTRFYIEQAQLIVTPQWINEKLVFARVVWGREAYTDIVVDVESGDVVYEEEARGGPDLGGNGSRRVHQCDRGPAGTDASPI